MLLFDEFLIGGICFDIVGTVSFLNGFILWNNLVLIYDDTIDLELLWTYLFDLIGVWMLEGVKLYCVNEVSDAVLILRFENGICWLLFWIMFLSLSLLE